MCHNRHKASDWLTERDNVGISKRDSMPGQGEWCSLAAMFPRLRRSCLHVSWSLRLDPCRMFWRLCSCITLPWSGCYLFRGIAFLLPLFSRLGVVRLVRGLIVSRLEGNLCFWKENFLAICMCGTRLRSSPDLCDRRAFFVFFYPQLHIILLYHMQNSSRF